MPYEERTKSGEHLRAAIASKRSRGEKLGGAVPIGFKAQSVRRGGRTVLLLIEDAEERALMRSVKVMHEEEGLSWECIAAHLNVHEVPRRNGDEWTKNSVRRLAGAMK